jgi:hypothetical protein
LLQVLNVAVLPVLDLFAHADQWREIRMSQINEIHDRGLTAAQLTGFVQDGFVRLENAFSQEVAEDARAILWRDSGCDPDHPSTWTRPVVWLGDYAQEPFHKAVNTKILHVAFDQLVGAGRWVPRTSLGSFPIRFPHADDPGGTGWHVDASFPPEGAAESYLEWRINFKSKGRALLMLFLFSDVGEKDAPTRIRVGSHLRIPRLLEPAGEAGMSALELGPMAERATRGMREVSATGMAGTVYLCHPFLVHAAQSHRGTNPRFMAQPPLIPKSPLELERVDDDYSLIERAILLGLNDLS